MNPVSTLIATSGLPRIICIKRLAVCVGGIKVRLSQMRMSMIGLRMSVILTAVAITIVIRLMMRIEDKGSGDLARARHRALTPLRTVWMRHFERQTHTVPAPPCMPNRNFPWWINCGNIFSPFSAAVRTPLQPHMDTQRLRGVRPSAPVRDCSNGKFSCMASADVYMCMGMRLIVCILLCCLLLLASFRFRLQDFRNYLCVHTDYRSHFRVHSGKNIRFVSLLTPVFWLSAGRLNGAEICCCRSAWVMHVLVSESWFIGFVCGLAHRIRWWKTFPRHF